MDIFKIQVRTVLLATQAAKLATVPQPQTASLVTHAALSKHPMTPVLTHAILPAKLAMELCLPTASPVTPTAPLHRIIHVFLVIQAAKPAVVA
jgi:hypothetical protein